MTFRLWLWEFLAIPAHAWLWLISRMLGYEFCCGPVDDPSDPLE